jgi:hypothetical protein
MTIGDRRKKVAVGDIEDGYDDEQKVIEPRKRLHSLAKAQRSERLGIEKIIEHG